MPKSKRAPALFELINTRSNGKADNKLALPKWFKTAPAAQDRPQTNVESPAHPASPAAPPARSATPPIEKKASLPPRPPAKSTPDSDDSVVRIRTGRLELSLNPANAVIAGGVLFLALVSTYLLGQAISSRSNPGTQLADSSIPVDDVRQAMHQTANGQVLEPSRNATLMSTRPPAHQEPRSASETGEPDKNQNLAEGAMDGSRGSGGPNRIVIESFKAEAEDVKAAKHIREWLATQYGLRTELRQFGDRIWLVTQDGFDLDQPGQKEAMNKMIEDIKSLGGTCARELASQKLPVYRLASPYPRRLEK